MYLCVGYIVLELDNGNIIEESGGVPARVFDHTINININSLQLRLISGGDVVLPQPHYAGFPAAPIKTVSCCQDCVSRDERSSTHHRDT